MESTFGTSRGIYELQGCLIEARAMLEEYMAYAELMRAIGHGFVPIVAPGVGPDHVLARIEASIENLGVAYNAIARAA